METLFLGKPIDYWVALRETVEDAGSDRAELLQEIFKLRGKVSLYEDRIEKLNEIMISFK